MLSSFRNLSKSKVGTGILVVFLLLVVASFAVGDIANLQGGSAGMSSSTLAKVGDSEVTERDASQAMERALSAARQQNPEATYASIAGQFDSLLGSLIDARALFEFARESGFHLSKRLVDAEIANIPGTKGLDGRFSEQNYRQFLAQQRLTDATVREALTGDLLERMMLTPLITNPRIPVGVATPYASMLLEARQGDVATIPVAAFRTGLNPTDADLQSFYGQNRNRYLVPEQRVIRMARIGPAQVSGAAPTDQEVAAYYNANQATYGGRNSRTLSQAVVPNQAVANQIAARAKAGGTFAAAAAPAGLSATDVALGEQTRAQLTGVAGEAVANAAFGAAQGAVVGPVRSDLGWHVLKVEAINSGGGRTLAQARDEIVTRLAAEKSKEALTDLVTRIEDSLADGASFADIVSQFKLPVEQTPLINAAGQSRADPQFRLPAELQPSLRTAFELAANDDPVVETLPNETGYLLVSPGQIVPAAAAPLAEIRDRVRQDWINDRARNRAQAAASAIAAKVARNVPIAQAVREAGVALPAVRGIGGRRLQLSEMRGQVPPPLQMLFTLGQGRSRLVADPAAEAFHVVKVNRIVPGNALNQPSLITQISREFQGALTEEYGRQMLAAMRNHVRVRRNEDAIAAAKARITTVN